MQDHGPRIVILSGRDVIRHGMRSMLGGLHQRARFAYHLDASVPADVVIVDAAGSAEGDVEQLESVLDGTTAPVIVFTAGATLDGFSRWRRPVHGFVTAAATAGEVVATVEGAVRSGRRGETARALAATPAASVSGLSNREVEVLTAVAAGLSNTEIAESLYLGINTVKTYIRTAYRKIGAVSRSQAVIWALEHGLGADGVGPGPATGAETHAWAGDELDDAR